MNHHQPHFRKSYRHDPVPRLVPSLIAILLINAGFIILVASLSTAIDLVGW